jgi:predicted permease
MASIGSWLRSEWARVRGLAGQDARAERFSDEAEFHVDMLAERHVLEGVPPEEARRRALVEFGGVDRFREASRDEYRSRPLEELAHDVRLAVRNLAQIPAFTLAAVLTLALGIGATTVVFSIVDHVVLRPLPYRDAERLVLVREVVHEIRDHLPSLGARAAHYLDWRERCSVCDDVAALTPVAFTWTREGEPVRVTGVRTSANLFPMLGVQADQGRLFLEAEDAPEQSDVVVLAHGFWLRHFGGDPSAIGRTLKLNGVARVIVGVLPRNFRLPKGDELGDRAAMHSDPDVYVPLALTQMQITAGGSWNYIALARLGPGVSAAQAETHFTALQESLASQMPQPITLSALIVPLQQQVVRGAGQGLLLLLAAVGAVLLLVCVNLANLLLARSASRAREHAIRVALGAGRMRLVRAALTESVVLAVAAGFVGLTLSWWGLQLLLQLAPADLPRLHEVRLDARVAGVAVLLSLLTGFLFGALPALRTAGADPGDVLKSGGRSRGDDRSRTRARSALIATQVGMTAVLLAAAGLFLASFVRVLGIDTGFSADRVLAVDVVVPGTEYTSAGELQAIYARMLQELTATPGIAGAAATSKLPLEGVAWADGIAAEGDPRPVVEWPVGNYQFVTNDYFRTLGIPLRSGAAFTESQRGAHVVVLSERAASQIWPGEDVVGRRVHLGGSLVAEVVGVAADVTATGLEAERSAIVYLPTWTPHGFPAAASITVRSVMDPAYAASSVRAALRSAVPGVVISGERTMQQLVADAAAARRFQLTLLIAFALTALATASVGIYGVIAHSLARRRGEIGVRMALGARRGVIHRLILGEGLRAAGVGIVGGLAVIVISGRLIASLLYEVRPADPVVLGAVAALLAGVAALASYVPARRATARGPSAVLRQE